MFGVGNQPDNLDAYMNLGSKEIVRLVLLLLVEERLRKQLAAFRAENVRGRQNRPCMSASKNAPVDITDRLSNAEENRRCGRGRAL
jgi:hypothetical protein